MVSWLGSALLVAVLLLVPATAAVFTVRQQRRVRAGTTLTRAVAAGLVVALLALAAAAATGRAPTTATVLAVLFGGSVVAWRAAAREWAARGLVAWALTVDTGLLYLAYVLAWTATAGLGPVGTVASLALWLLEAFVFLIGVGYVWELVDALARRTWSQYVSADGHDDAAHPFVSLHVPTHNEPPDMVIATVESLLALDYDQYEVLVVDNNTDDPALWQPVAAWCKGRPGVRFLHLADWPGYKSGALNEALRVSDPRAEVIGIVDADYQVEPDWLARCVPLFGDPDVAFVQTPQDYRDWEEMPYFRRLYYSYGYFFDVSQRSRNERNGAIFGGTMGLIRRSGLESVGGWDEWCITEDAELSLRLLRVGGRGVHVDQTFGRGLMPLTFEALKRQRFRWCFGGIQILRMHWRSLLPGRRTADNRLTLAQRWAYLVGGLQWFSDLAGLLFTGFLLVGAADAVVGTGVVMRRLSPLLVVCIAVLVVLGAVRSIALVKRTSGARWTEAFGAFGLWLALGWSVAQASFRGLVAREGAFLRTPKVRGELGWRDAWRGNRFETALGLLSVGVGAVALASGGVGGSIVGALLLVQGCGYLAAPVNSLAAIRSDLTEEQRRRRRDLRPSGGAPAARRGGFVLVASLAVVCGLVVFAAPVDHPDQRWLAEIAEPDESEQAPDDDRRRSGDGRTEPTTGDAVPGSTSSPPDAPASSTLSPGGRTSPVAPTTQAPASQAPRQTTPPAATQSPTQQQEPTQARSTNAPATPPTTQRPSGGPGARTTPDGGQR